MDESPLFDEMERGEALRKGARHTDQRTAQIQRHIERDIPEFSQLCMNLEELEKYSSDTLCQFSLIMRRLMAHLSTVRSQLLLRLGPLNLVVKGQTTLPLNQLHYHDPSAHDAVIDMRILDRHINAIIRKRMDRNEAHREQFPPRPRH